MNKSSLRPITKQRNNVILSPKVTCFPFACTTRKPLKGSKKFTVKRGQFQGRDTFSVFPQRLSTTCSHSRLASFFRFSRHTLMILAELPIREKKGVPFIGSTFSEKAKELSQLPTEISKYKSKDYILFLTFRFTCLGSLYGPFPL